MKSLTKSLPIDYDRIEKAFQAFYQHMRHSTHFRHFFKSDDQIDSLIVKQAKNFYKSFSMTKEAFRQNYIRLGYMHSEMGLPIEDMFAGLNLVRDNILNHTSSQFHQAIYQLIEKMEKWLAKGYFQHQLEETKELVDISIKNIKKVTPKEDQHYVLRPIIWLNTLLHHYSDKDFKVTPATQCPLTGIIDSLEMEPTIKEQLHKGHNEQHALGGSFLYFYHEENYTLVGFILSKLSAISLALSNQMSYAVSQNIIQNLQHDPLTGLLTRHSLEEQFELMRNLAKGQNEGFSTLMLDIDHFKSINDTYGHQAGDEVLRKVGQLLQQHARKHDIPFRYGGEEFLMFVTHLQAKDLPAIAERIREAIEQLDIEWNGQSIPITISIGCHWVSPQTITQPMEKIIEIADQNLYHSKDHGRNQVTCTGVKA